MVDQLTLRRMGFWACFAGLAALIIFVRVLPYHVSRDSVPPPDLLVLTAFAWVMRRPDYVPVPLVATVMLLSDILFMRPLGLWTALVLLGLEFLRVRRNVSSELPFAVEWMLVTSVLFAIALANGLFLALFVVPQAPFTANLMHIFITAAAYPLVVMVSVFGLGVRTATPANREGSSA